MIIPLEFYDRLRQQIKISDIIRQKVSLTKKGNEYLGLCPFHTEKTPSFTVNDSKKFYHCFGCGAHGDVIKFVAETGGFSYKQAAIKIAQENAIDLPKISADQKKEAQEADQIYNILEMASSYFSSQMTKEVQGYLLSRNIDEEAQKRFSIGYAPARGELIKFFKTKNISPQILIDSGLVVKKDQGQIYEIFNKRIMFPIRNIYNKIVGFGGRVMDNSLPKYINSPESLVFKKGEVMYGENIATSAVYKKNYSIVVEGYMDVIALNIAGINEAVASLGTSVTDKHLQKLWRLGDKIIVCLDGDLAGKRAARRLVDLALPIVNSKKEISFVNLPNSQDPDDFIKKNGVTSFHKLLSQKKTLSEIIWFGEVENKDFSSAESRAKLEQKLQIFCSQISDKILSNNFRRYFKNQMWQNFYAYKRISDVSKKTMQTNVEKLHNKNYSEIEVLELSLIYFIIKFPHILQNQRIRDFVSGLDLASNGLEEFKEWLINLSNKYDEINENKVVELIKNTRFYRQFLVVSDPQKSFLDMVFIEKNKAHYQQIFDLLHKKHYLLLLKLEYSGIMSSAKEEVYLKLPYYVKEIRKTTKELTELSEFFID